MHRNLEAARDLAAGREFGVFVIGEEEIPETALGSPEAGLPHLNTAGRAELMSHYLGTLTWSQVCDVTGMDYRSLPRNVARRGCWRSIAASVRSGFGFSPGDVTFWKVMEERRVRSCNRRLAVLELARFMVVHGVRTTNHRDNISMAVPTYPHFIEPTLRFLAAHPEGAAAKHVHDAAATQRSQLP